MAVQARAHDEAIALFRRVLDQDPAYAEARLNLAVAELQAGRVDAARDEVRTILRAPASSMSPEVRDRASRLLSDLGT
jgi:thioredoxin-like negative regulator of GroEL